MLHEIRTVRYDNSSICLGCPGEKCRHLHDNFYQLVSTNVKNVKGARWIKEISTTAAAAEHLDGNICKSCREPFAMPPSSLTLKNMTRRADDAHTIATIS